MKSRFHGMGAYFLADLGAVRRILPEGARPIRLPAGRALVGFHAIENRESDLGAYNEVVISIPLIPRGRKPWKLEKHVYRLPVSTEESYRVVSERFRLPAIQADVEFRENKTHRICTVRDRVSHELILEMDSRKPARLRGNPLGRILPSVKIALQEKAHFEVAPQELAVSAILPRMDVRLGVKHPLAQELRRWRIGPQLLFFFAPDCAGALKAREGEEERR